MERVCVFLRPACTACLQAPEGLPRPLPLLGTSQSCPVILRSHEDMPGSLPWVSRRRLKEQAADFVISHVSDFLTCIFCKAFSAFQCSALLKRLLSLSPLP